MVISTGLKILYSFLYRKYIKNIWIFCSESFSPATTLQSSWNPGRTGLMDQYLVAGDKATPCYEAVTLL
jgi:hypothetical protein